MKSKHQSEFNRLIDYLASYCYTGVMDWERNIIAGAEQIRDLILQTKRIAVLGIKTEAQGDQPAFYVPDYLVLRYAIAFTYHAANGFPV